MTMLVEIDDSRVGERRKRIKKGRKRKKRGKFNDNSPPEQRNEIDFITTR